MTTKTILERRVKRVRNLPFSDKQQYRSRERTNLLSMLKKKKKPEEEEKQREEEGRRRRQV